MNPATGNLPRRTFLLSTLGALAGLLLLRFRVPGDIAGDSAGRLQELMVHSRVAAAAVGRDYLRLRPAEADRRMLVSLICQDCLSNEQILSMRDHDLLEVLRAKIRADFQSGRTVSARGWILSETEARLYSLATFI